MGVYENPPYYLTAYGLAKKRGFEGTLDDWLASLKAIPGELRCVNNVIQWRYNKDADTSDTAWHDLLSLTDVENTVKAAVLESAQSYEKNARIYAASAGAAKEAAEASAAAAAAATSGMTQKLGFLGADIPALEGTVLVNCDGMLRPTNLQINDYVLGSNGVLGRLTRVIPDASVNVQSCGVSLYSLLVNDVLNSQLAVSAENPYDDDLKTLVESYMRDSQIALLDLDPALYPEVMADLPTELTADGNNLQLLVCKVSEFGGGQYSLLLFAVNAQTQSGIYAAQASGDASSAAAWEMSRWVRLGPEGTILYNQLTFANGTWHSQLTGAQLTTAIGAGKLPICRDTPSGGVSKFFQLEGVNRSAVSFFHFNGSVKTTVTIASDGTTTAETVTFATAASS